MALEYPTVNGRRVSWSDVTIYVANIAILGVKAISYKWTMKPEQVYGTHPAPIGQTTGKLELSGSIELYKEEAKELRNALGDGFAEAIFRIVVQFDDGKGVEQVEINDCRLSDEDYSGASGAEASSQKFELSFTDLVIDGKRPYRRALTVQAS